MSSVVVVISVLRVNIRGIMMRMQISWILEPSCISYFLRGDSNETQQEKLGKH